MSVLAGAEDTRADILAIVESLRRTLENAHRASRDLNRESKAPPGKVISIPIIPVWALNNPGNLGPGKP